MHNIFYLFLITISFNFETHTHTMQSYTMRQEISDKRDTHTNTHHIINTDKRKSKKEKQNIGS